MANKISITLSLAECLNDYRKAADRGAEDLGLIAGRLANSVSEPQSVEISGKRKAAFHILENRIFNGSYASPLSSHFVLASRRRTVVTCNLASLRASLTSGLPSISFRNRDRPRCV